MTFRGNVALVTGAASGMGQMSAIRLAEQGAKVMGLDMDLAGLANLSERYPTIQTQQCDVSDYEEVQAVVEKTKTDLGAIDRLTHAAAVMPLASINKMPVEVITRQMRINYDGTVHMIKSVLPDMITRDQGDIISFGSIAGEVPLPEAGGYCATKAATNAFFKQLVCENKKRKIRFLLVCPPPVNTPLLNAEKTGSRAFSDKEMKRALKLGLVVEPEFILDQIEKGIDKRKNIIFPGFSAKLFVNLYRLSPSLYHNLIPGV